jgi:hypothetical protein
MWAALRFTGEACATDQTRQISTKGLAMNKTFSARAIFCAATAILAATTFIAPSARAQGSRKDDIVFGPSGHPVSDATIRVCASTATGTPCTPLATIYTDATLTVPASNPFQSDGIGNYHFYAPDVTNYNSAARASAAPSQFPT